MNNEDNGYTTYCSRCGAEMNSNSRYCMKCGNLNYNHEANESMRKFIKDDNNGYEVGSGKFMFSNTTDKVDTVVGNNMGNKKLCFIVNFSIYMFIIISNFLSTIKGTGLDLIGIRDSLFPYTAITYSVVFLYVYSIQLLFMKCNKPWWSGLIPIYNMIILADILYHKKWLGLLVLVPYVNVVFILVMFYSLGKRFKYNGILTAVFSIIFIPIIGFGNSAFEGHNFVSNLSQVESEKDYRRKRIFLVTIVFFIVSGVGLIIWNNKDTVHTRTSTLKNYYYVYASDRIVSTTKKNIRNKKVTCSNSYSETSGVYYFIYKDIGNYTYLPFYYQMEAISGYVKVDNTSGTSKYYVSLSDGTKGFSEVDIDYLNKDMIVDYPKVSEFSDDSVNKCTIEKGLLAKN